MLSGITIGQYFPGRSLVHRMDPRVKLLLTIAYVVALFLTNSFWGYLLAGAFLVFCYALAKI